MSVVVDEVGVVRDGRHILRRMAFRVDAGCFVGILGPSGSGKSTLLEVLSLTGTATEGRIFFDDRQDITKQAEEYRKCFRYVPQHDALYPTLNVREHVRDVARLRLSRMTDEEISQAVDAALTQVGLLEHADKAVGKLSGGQRKRVSIAMALLGQPRLLILDEPTTGLDPAMERRLMLLLRHIADSGITVICTTHVMENVRLFDRVAVIDKIRVVDQEAECGRLLDYLPRVDFLEKIKEQNEDYARFFEQLEAEPGEFFWNKSVNGTAATEGLFSDLARPLQIAFGPVGDTLDRKVVQPGKRVWRRSFSLLRALDSCLDNLTRRIRPLWQTCDVVRRSGKVFLRDRFLVATTVTLPPLLGFLIVLSQQNETNLMPLLFFSLIVALWFGMNNTVRCIVSERRQFVRENLAGLTMNGYLGGKTLFYLLVGAVQIGVLTLVVQGLARLLCREMLCEKLALIGVGEFFATLFAVYLAGLGLGLLVSTLASTESVAVALVPLLIMPQILLSTVAAGNSAQNFDDPERILPLAIAATQQTSGWETSQGTTLFKAASVACFSRPALLLQELRVREYEDQRAYLLEILHFLLLTAVTWTGLWCAFRYNMKKWRTQRG